MVTKMVVPEKREAKVQLVTRPHNHARRTPDAMIVPCAGKGCHVQLIVPIERYEKDKLYYCRGTFCKYERTTQTGVR